MNLLDNKAINKDTSYIWLANFLILVVVVLLGTVTAARYLSLV